MAKKSAESDARPRVVVLAGPNGAGKSTTAKEVLQGALRVNEFVNADQIALGLSGFTPDTAAYEAGAVMLRRIRELARRRVDFGFETTLASRSLAPWLRDLISTGYEFHLVFLWLPSPEIAIARVAERVKAGGHDVPEETIRRRYQRGLRNLFELYAPLAESWRVLNNSRRPLRLVANGKGETVVRVSSEAIWTQIKRR